MTSSANIGDKDGTMLVQIPLQLRQRGGRKLVVTPDGISARNPPRTRVDSAMVKAVARAYRWRRMLERGEYDTITELADFEKINQSYVCRILRLTLLAPDIVEAILDGRQPLGLQFEAVLKPFAKEWPAQRNAFGFAK